MEPASLRQRLAAAVAEAPSADLDSRRRLGRNLALVRRARLRLLLPLVLRLSRGLQDHAWVLGRDGAARQGAQSLSRGLPAVRRRRRDARGSHEALPRACRVLLRPLLASR